MLSSVGERLCVLDSSVNEVHEGLDSRRARILSSEFGPHSRSVAGKESLKE